MDHTTQTTHEIYTWGNMLYPQTTEQINHKPQVIIVKGAHLFRKSIYFYYHNSRYSLFKYIELQSLLRRREKHRLLQEPDQLSFTAWQRTKLFLNIIRLRSPLHVLGFHQFSILTINPHVAFLFHAINHPLFPYHITIPPLFPSHIMTLPEAINHNRPNNPNSVSSEFDSTVRHARETCKSSNSPIRTCKNR
jgi:hypothetical protein